MTDQFVALDVETANPHPGSICSVGRARFERGAVVDEHYTLINPDQYFADHLTDIHGIQADDVASAPLFSDALDQLGRFIGGAPVLHHTHFDRTAVHRACEDWGVAAPGWAWFDSAEVARRTWRQFAHRGYSLANLCRHIGYQFRHHHALEDAKAGGYVTLAAMRERGVASFEELRSDLDLTQRCIAPPSSASRPFDGEVVAFAGRCSDARRVLSERVEELGGESTERVTKRTMLVVAGTRADTRELDKARRYHEAGLPVQIVSEYDFNVMCTPGRKPLL